MTFNDALALLKDHFTWPLLGLAALLLGSEFMGNNEKIKASSWYGLIKAVVASAVATFKDQVKAVPPQAPLPTPPESPKAE